jgi:predicted CXXCH cytochrome family protein
MRIDRRQLVKRIQLLAGAPALLLAGGLLWLFGAAPPTLADGGPHVAGANSGFDTLTTDSCAGCHRAHTAQGAYLIRTSSQEELCLTCHGSAGAGATTDVESGIQYKVAGAAGGAGQDETDPGVVAGALRGGGFVTARIDSAHPSRISYPHLDATVNRVVADFSSQVPVLAAGQPVTSAHLKLAGATAVTIQDRAWGNIAEGSVSATPYAGPAVELECASCHNPHGNDRYRILNPIPSLTSTSTDAFVRAVMGADVTDAALPGADAARN